MGKWLHRLSQIDRINKIAMCSECGKTKIRIQGASYRCLIAIAEYRRVNGHRIKYHEPNPGVCSICKNTVRVSYDHDHATGKFRGWLCINCNTALGLVKDDPGRLKQLISYLESWPTA